MSFRTERVRTITETRIRHDMISFRNLSEQTMIVEERNLFCWEVTIKGPEDSPYSGHYYLLTVNFPMDYPDNPPLLVMRTPIYHPNIAGDNYDQNDKIGLNILTPDGWSKDFTISDVFQKLENLMKNPDLNEEFVVNKKAATLYTNDRQEYERVANECRPMLN